MYQIIKKTNGDDIKKMPWGDRTGPRGEGPMTGRALGYCAGYSTPGYTKGYGMGLGRGWGRGMGLGRGRGRGYGGWWRGGIPLYQPYTIPPPIYTPAPVLTQKDQLSMLKQEKEYMESEMNEIKRAMEDITKKIEELEIKE